MSRVVEGPGIEVEQLWHDRTRWASWLDGFASLQKLEGAWRGLGIGLVGGALVALFPAVGIGAGLLLGGAGGAGLGALAGHVTAGLKRADCDCR